MADDIEVTVNQSALREFLVAEDGPIAKMLERAAVKVEADAIRRCPVDTGRLRASITHNLGKDSTSVFADVGTDVEYAPYVEFGTVRNRAQPFLRPALDVLNGGVA